MQIQRKLTRAGILMLSLYLPSPAYSANDEDLCAPFKDAKIDQSLIAQMLNAAEDGYLFQIKNESSKMGFCVDSPVGMVEGSFQQFKGGIALQEPGNRTLVSVDLDSLQTNTPFTEDLLKGDLFFNVKNHPELIFISSGFEWLSETRAILKGELSLNGITRTVAFYVEITELDGDLGDADTILVKATTTVQRSQFNMSNLSPMVSDRVNLCMSVEAERYKSL